MNWVDLALLGLCVASVLLGAWRGLVFELMTLAGWLVAYAAAPYVAPAVERLLPLDKAGPTMTHALGLVIAFVLVLLVWGLGAKLIRALIHATPLGLLDRLGGAAFGVLRAALLALLATVIVGMTPAVRSEAWTGSQAAPWLTAALAQVRPLLPEALHDYIPA
ncbi:CvpA family protein [Mitsuaria sp. GD03876]|uniref:CvpA family protein n=1 Tax=Mitsuaria sp. GD03876 TaxID=2975399 RepID=UPI002446FAB1|nr:CvpA family protein [Mitsuaria sp. GD03876]MDH0867249.1 CvpA family protein [Mitsuaria sp. GD03876]